MTNYLQEHDNVHCHEIVSCYFLNFAASYQGLYSASFALSSGKCPS